MKIALINDTHFGARNDSQAFMNYFRKFYEEIFFPTLEERGIKDIIHLGDVVDRRKFINWKTVYQMREMFFDVCHERHINLHLIVGNHDTYFRNTNIVNSLDGLRLQNNHQFHIYEESTEIELDGNKFFLQPWICDENKEQSLKAIEETTAQILFGHLEVKGFEMHAGQYSQTGIDASMFNKFDMAFSGHFHHKSDNGNIYYLGNQYQITWSDYKDTKGFHIFDTETRELERIVNPLTIFDKIYYDDTKTDYSTIDVEKYKNKYIKLIVVNKKDLYGFDAFVDKLLKTDTYEVKIIEDFTDLDASTVSDDIVNNSEDTLTILNKYVDELDVTLDKNRLKNTMKSLYTEAQDLEI